MRRLLVAGLPMTLAGMTVLVLLGIEAVLGVSEPEDEWSRFGQATTVDGLTIVVERGSGRLYPGRETTYTIAVGNRGTEPAPVTVRAAVPPWLRVAPPPEGVEAHGGFADWPVTLAPGEVTTVRLSGAYEAGEVPRRVTFTACVLERAEGQPVVCATDAAQLERDWLAANWWWVAALLALAVAAATTAVLRVRRAGSFRLRSRSVAPGR